MLRGPIGAKPTTLHRAIRSACHRTDVPALPEYGQPGLGSRRSFNGAVRRMKTAILSIRQALMLSLATGLTLAGGMVPVTRAAV